MKFLEIKEKLKPIQIDARIRLGRNWDGGYVMSQQLLDASDGLISLGINDEWSFEQHYLSKKPTSTAILYDDKSSSRSILKDFIKSCAAMLYRFSNPIVKTSWKSSQNLYRKYIEFSRITTGKVEYIKGRIGRNIDDGEVSLTSVLNRFTGAKSTNSVLLKIDIEGSEYSIVDEISQHANSFSGVIVEFHNVLSKPELINKALTVLLSDFYVEHVHLNNFTAFNDVLSDALEVTFIHKSLVKNPVLTSIDLPLPDLDFPCDRTKADLKLSFTN